MKRKITKQAGKCGICQDEFTDYNDVVPYADVGIKHRMPTFRICRPCMTTGEGTVVPGRTMSAYSERLKEREERVGWAVTAGTGIYRRGPRECLLFKGEVGMEINRWIACEGLDGSNAP